MQTPALFDPRIALVLALAAAPLACDEGEDPDLVELAAEVDDEPEAEDPIAGPAPSNVLVVDGEPMLSGNCSNTGSFQSGSCETETFWCDSAIPGCYSHCISTTCEDADGELSNDLECFEGAGCGSVN